MCQNTCVPSEKIPWVQFLSAVLCCSNTRTAAGPQALPSCLALELTAACKMSSGITFISGWGCVLFVFAGLVWQLIEAGRQIASWVVGSAKST